MLPDGEPATQIRKPREPHSRTLETTDGIVAHCRMPIAGAARDPGGYGLIIRCSSDENGCSLEKNCRWKRKKGNIVIR